MCAELRVGTPILLGLASFRKLHLMASVQLIIIIMAPKIIVFRLNFRIKTNRHLNIRLELHI